MAMDVASSAAAVNVAPAFGASADSHGGGHPQDRPSDLAPAPEAPPSASPPDVSDHDMLAPSTVAALVAQQMAESGREAIGPAQAPSAAFMWMAISHAYPRAAAARRSAMRGRAAPETRSFAPTGLKPYDDR